MADGTLKVGTITTSSGSGTITLGQSGETVSVPSGVTLSGGVTNTPAFRATLSSDQSIADNTTTTVLFNSEVFDTDSAYDTSTGKFQPQTAGKYYVYTVLRNDTSGTYEVNARITKNGSDVVGDSVIDNTGNESTVTFTTVELNGSSDYLIVTTYQNSGGAKNIRGSTTDRTYFGAYRIIGA